MMDLALGLSITIFGISCIVFYYAFKYMAMTVKFRDTLLKKAIVVARLEIIEENKQRAEELHDQLKDRLSKIRELDNEFARKPKD